MTPGPDTDPRQLPPARRLTQPHLRLRWAVLLGTLLLVLTLLIGAQVFIDRSYVSALDRATATLDHTGRAAEGIVNGQLLQVDSALASLPALLSSLGQAQGSAGPQPTLAARLLLGINFQSFAYRDLMILRPSGEIWASARSNARLHRFPIAPETLMAHTSPGSSALFGPVRSAASGDWMIYLVRPVNLPGLGMSYAAAEVPISSITSPLSTDSDIPGVRIALTRSDGTLVASLPHDELNTGKVVADLVPPANQKGAPIAEGVVAGRPERFRVVRPTLYGDLSVNVVLDARTATSDWARDRERLMIALAVAVVMLMLFGIVVMIGLRSQELLHADRRKAQSLLEDAIDSMSDGFVMWDEEDRLVTCNHSYLTLYSRNAEVLKPGIRFEDVLRWGCQNGQYAGVGGDVEAFVQTILDRHTRGEGSYEQELPDGRWVLVTERRTENGGSVGIRKDITALKRQEELIVRYSRELERLASRFESSVRSGAAQLEVSVRNANVEVDTMVGAASEALAQARMVSSSAEGTSSTVGVIAARSEQLLSSINRILEQVKTAARMADHAAVCSRSATQVMASLDEAASRIYAVVDLIGSIASQTNLLALNATIEAARAGEAGRGFAVVASEVKALAAQTTRSTDSIGQHVRAIQQSSVEAVSSIETIHSMVDELKAIADSVEKAVLEQSRAASEIATSTQETAASTSQVSRAVLMIADRSEQISRSTEGLRNTAQKLLADAHVLGGESERFLASVKSRA